MTEHISKKEHTITPFLWFDDNAEAAINQYSAIFENSKMQKVFRMPDGRVLTASFQLDGQAFTALNGGPQFKFNPAISFFVVCDTEAATDAIWHSLIEGGSVLMPLDQYAWSARYGWVQDRFGVSWQVMLDTPAENRPTFIPCLMFAGDLHARADEAIQFYTSVFQNTGIDRVMRQEPLENEPVGRIIHAQFDLNGQVFVIMGSAMPHNFSFNEAVSFVISCETQTEIDYYWNALTADGGAESRCGWLKDKFGVSWQVVPPVLGKLLGDPDPAKSNRVMQAMLQMNKIDIATLEQAYQQQ